MKMTIPFKTGLMAIQLSVFANAYAENFRVMVTIENLAPRFGTFQTPHWVGFHDGSFDIYDGGTPADNDPIPNDPRRSVERLAEDGNTAPITETFAELQPEGIDGTIAGPDGALGPGEVTSMSFLLDGHNTAHRYFSYASMLLPSNDFWYANGNPLEHPVFDEEGSFVAQNFFVTNLDLLDAGTEVNDEIPENTAFFGQQTPDTGTPENGVIKDFLDDNAEPQLAFRPVGSGGILDNDRFSMADFSQSGYPLVKISFKASPAIIDNHVFISKLTGEDQVPAVETDAYGLAKYYYDSERGEIRFLHLLSLPKEEISHVYLHAGNPGDNGPIIAELAGKDFSHSDLRNASGAQRILYLSVLYGAVDSSDLQGEYQGQPIDAIVEAIKQGKVYVSVKSKSYPDGEIRGQLYSEG